MTDKISLMTAFAGLFAGMHSGYSMLNGQYILIKASIFRACGGFEAVKNEAVEDLALAEKLRQHGYTVPIFLGQKTAKVRMYEDARHLWRGLARIASGALKWSGVGGWLTALFIAGALLPLVAIPLVLFAGMPVIWLAIAWAVVVTAFLPWARRSGNVLYAFLAPFGALFVQLAALAGLTRSTIGSGIIWKGRKV